LILYFLFKISFSSQTTVWEMACARNIGLTTLPIVCVNVDGYYENFRAILERASQDELIKLKPHEIVHFEPTAEAAVKWLEEQAKLKSQTRPKLRRRTSQLNSSFMAPPVGGWSWFRRSVSWVESGVFGVNNQEGESYLLDKVLAYRPPSWTYAFAAGVAVGAVASTARRSQRREIRSLGVEIEIGHHKLTCFVRCTCMSMYLLFFCR
jgi:hypothetical protein